MFEQIENDYRRRVIRMTPTNGAFTMQHDKKSLHPRITTTAEAACAPVLRSLPLLILASTLLIARAAHSQYVCDSDTLGEAGEGASATGTDSMACGANARAAGDASTAVGTGADAGGENGTAIGYSAFANVARSTALGTNAAATGTNSIALGADSVADENSTVSIGSTGNERRITNLTAGINGTDAVNLNQLDALASTADQALSDSAIAQSTADQALTDAAGAQTTADQALTDAAGAQTTADQALTNAAGAQATADQALTNAAGAQATADQALMEAGNAQSTADAALATANQKVDRGTIGNIQAFAVGSGSFAAGTGDTAVGLNSSVGARGGTAVGSSATIAGSAGNSVALGADAGVSAANGTALGHGATVSADNAVAIGAGSVAGEADTVSVGSIGNERRVTNVADAEADTDAVNKGLMDEGDAATLAAANSHTDARMVEAAGTLTELGALNERMDLFDLRLRQTDRRLNRLGAMSMATTQMAINAGGSQCADPSSWRDCGGRLALGAGWQSGEEAISIGYGRPLGERGRFSLGGTASGDSRSVGVGFGFDL